MTWPGAVIRPKIWLGWVSMTRFSVADWALGCWKLTVASLPMLKLVQSTTALWLVWLMLSVLADWLMLAWPAATWPPLGSWVATTGAPVVCANTGAENKPSVPRRLTDTHR